ncbi:MAG: DNA primase [Dictyoglomus sp.]|nr:DNA primase [Dictyoglomus sp.]MCX7941665.1 DNA primase [Dictyoglomaceae bacterium]MDW8188183.1 DNA primase [Dictyoglomus sp.]
MVFSLEEFVDDVKQRINIVDIIGRYVNLKKSGKNFVGLCPFHSERTPSFYVSPEKGLYHCFGCGASGDVFSFIMNYRNISFMTALEELAQEVGLELPKISKKETQEFNILLEIIKETANFYSIYLKSKYGIEGREYLRKRNIKPQTQDKFLLGLSPKNPMLLYRYLIKKGFSEEDIIKSKVLYKIKQEWKDPFSGRLIFPIINHKGKIIGFGARTLSNEEPKYINSSESEIFNKREILYALYHGKEKIKKENKVLLVEGYMDAISLHQEGIDFVVASLGTSLTSSQARLLRSFTSNVIISYDQDPAGIQAGKRALSILELEDFKVLWLSLPSSFKDPDEFIREKGKEEFLKLVEESKDPLEFLIDYILSQETNFQEKLEGILEILTSSILRSKNILVQQEKVKSFLPYVSKKLNIPEEGLQREIKIRVSQWKDRLNNKKLGITKIFITSQLEEILLGLILLGVDNRNIQSLSPDDFTFPFYQEVLKKWRLWNKEKGLEEFINSWEEDKRIFLERAIKMGERHINEKEISFLWEEYRKEKIRRQIRLKKEELFLREKEGVEKEKIEELMKEIQWLKSQLEKAV